MKSLKGQAKKIILSLTFFQLYLKKNFVKTWLLAVNATTKKTVEEKFFFR